MIRTKIKICRIFASQPSRIMLEKRDGTRRLIAQRYARQSFARQKAEVGWTVYESCRTNTGWKLWVDK